jgi:superfamily II DNA or RNA helicase
MLLNRKLLREYTESFVFKIQTAWNKNSLRIIALVPISTVKESLYTYFIKKSLQQGERVLVLLQDSKLLDRVAQQLRETEGLQVEVIRPGRKISSNKSLYLSAPDRLTDRLTDRLKGIGQIDLIIVPEAQFIKPNLYRKIVEVYPNVRFLGFGSTPTRVNGKSMGFIYDELVVGESIGELVEMQLLAQPDYYKMLPAMITSPVQIKDGDYIHTDVASINDIQILGSNLVESYRTHARGLRCLVVATSIRHSKAIAQSYNLAGIKAYHLDEHTPKAVEQQTIERFAAGEIRVISCDRLSYSSYDLPPIEAIQIAFPTKSLTNYLHMLEKVLQVGRSKNRVAIVDHTDNWKLHGLPDTERYWRLDTNGDKYDLSAANWILGRQNYNSIGEILSRAIERQSTCIDLDRQQVMCLKQQDREQFCDLYGWVEDYHKVN